MNEFLLTVVARICTLPIHARTTFSITFPASQYETFKRSDGHTIRLPMDRGKGTIAAYWRAHYDLLHILRRDRKTLGPEVTGKVHIYCSDVDNYYLNNAVYLVEDFLKSVKSPVAASEVAYGSHARHG